MKKNLLILCALLLTAVGANAQSSWTAPTLPTSTLTDGGKYYLYNTEAEMYMGQVNLQWGTEAGFSDTGLLVTLDSSNGAYTIKNGTSYVFFDGTYLYVDGAESKDKKTFTFTAASDGTYTIQAAWSEETSNYLGHDAESTNAKENEIITTLASTDTGIYWELIAENAEDLYDALVILYNTLVHAESYGMTESDEAYAAAGTVYTSGTATADEVMAAVVALELAMEAYASEEDPDEVTYAFITNPDFSSYSNNTFTGWTSTGSMTSQTTPHTNGDITISVFPEKWVESTSSLGDAKISQTLANLPVGTYRLEADAIAVKQTSDSPEVMGVYLYASSLTTSMTSVSTTDGLPAHYTVNFEVAEEGSVEIGFKVISTNANWVAVDNFRLYYLSSEVTELTDTQSDYNEGDEATLYGHKYNILSDNMVENHSFELGFTGWTGANDFATEITASNFELHSGDAQDGEVYLVGTVNGGSDAASSLGKAWSIEAGKTYYFSYYVKSLGTATDGGYLETSLGDGKGTESVSLNTPTVTSEWQKIEVLFTNSNYEYVQVKFRWLDNQWGFDNFQLYQVEPAEDVLEGVVDDSEYKTGDVVNADGYACTIKSDNMFVNGGFNADMYGWTAGGYYVAADPANFDVEAEGGFNEGAYLVASSAGTSSEKTPSQAIAVELGKTYLFIGYTSGKTPSSGNVQYNALFKMSNAVTEASDDKIIVQLEWGADYEKESETWTKTTAVFTAETDYVGMRMGWSGGSYDGYQLYEVEAVELEYAYDVTWALANPSFEVDNVVANLTIDTTRGTEAGGAWTVESLTGWDLVVPNNSYSFHDIMTKDATATDNGFGVPGEPTDGTYMLYLRDGNNTTTSSVEQTITLPAGEYKLTVDSKCVSTGGSTAVLVAGGKSTSLDIHSSYGSEEDALDWDTAELILSLNAETDVTVGVDISYSSNGSFLLDNFKLYSVEEIEKAISWTMTDAGWGTMILPFAATLEEGLTAYSCNGTEESEDEEGNEMTVVSLEEVGQSIVANTPYIIKCTDDSAIKTHEFSGTPTNSVETYTEGIITGTLVDLAVAKGAALNIDGTNYVLQNHTEVEDGEEEAEGLAFYPITSASEGVELDAYHCYLTIESEDAEGSPTKLSIVLPGAGEETGIVAVESETLANDAIYDLSGRRVSKAVKGVYIQNGKKVLVK